MFYDMAHPGPVRFCQNRFIMTLKKDCSGRTAGARHLPSFRSNGITLHVRHPRSLGSMPSSASLSLTRPNLANLTSTRPRSGRRVEAMSPYNRVWRPRALKANVFLSTSSIRLRIPAGELHDEVEEGVAQDEPICADQSGYVSIRKHQAHVLKSCVKRTAVI